MRIPEDRKEYGTVNDVKFEIFAFNQKVTRQVKKMEITTRNETKSTNVTQK